MTINIFRNKRLQNKLEPYTWLSPSLILFILFLLYPIVFSVILSFFDWNGYTKNIFTDFVGWKNYLHLINDPLLWKSFRNTIFLVITVVFIQNAIALFLSLVIYFGKFKFGNLIRALIFFPGVISAIVIGLVFRKFLAIDGAINQFLEIVGLSGIEQAWLSNQSINIWIVSFVLVWQWTGYNLVIFYAGLQSVDQNLLEAAFIDGASLTRSIFNIVIPLMKPIIFLSGMLNFIGGFRIYDMIWVMTRGGPNHSSEVLTTYMYYQSFQSKGPSDMGYASTIAILLALIVIIFAIIRVRVVSRQEN
jgi:ABC-type sugar transport system permease subunit